LLSCDILKDSSKILYKLHPSGAKACSMRFAALFVLVLGAVLVSPMVEGVPLFGRGRFIGGSHEVLVPVPVIPRRRVGALLHCIVGGVDFEIFLLANSIILQ
jgi:hypothetical protein